MMVVVVELTGSKNEMVVDGGKWSGRDKNGENERLKVIFLVVVIEVISMK